jgi:hypothetical protein
MRRREIELRDAMAGAWAAARVSGGQFRQLVPVYSDRLGLAYQIMRGQQRRRASRAIVLAAIIATVGGAAGAVLAERLIAHRQPPEPTTETSDTEIAADEAPARQESTFTP